MFFLRILRSCEIGGGQERSLYESDFDIEVSQYM